MTLMITSSTVFYLFLPCASIENPLVILVGLRKSLHLVLPTSGFFRLPQLFLSVHVVLFGLA